MQNRNFCSKIDTYTYIIILYVAKQWDMDIIDWKTLWRDESGNRWIKLRRSVFNCNDSDEYAIYLTL